MENRRFDVWEGNNEVYTEEQIDAILNYIGIEIEGETTSHYLSYCPFHGNKDTPAFEISKTEGLWICFNPSCGERGNLIQLIRRRTGLDFYEAKRLILKHRNMNSEAFADKLRQKMMIQPEFIEFPQDILDRMYDDFWQSKTAQQYMIDRHFTEETLRYFRVGYSKKNNKIIVPMHDPTGMPIGLIGRTPSHIDKSFKNSKRLPKSKTTFNIHRAKKTGDTVVVVEASFDAMRVHQAGYPNVIATLGGHLSQFHIDQIGRHFSKIINMTDYDELRFEESRCNKCHGECHGHRDGRALGKQIIDAFPHKRTLWAAYDEEIVYPHSAKDPGDMTDDEIRQCLKNAISDFEYSMRSLP